MYGVALSSFLFLFSSANCLHSFLWTLLIFSEDQSVNGAEVSGLGHDLNICGLGVCGFPMVLGRLDGANRFAMVVLVVGHLDVTITGFIGLDVVGRVRVIMLAGA